MSGSGLESVLGDPLGEGALTFADLVADEDTSRLRGATAELLGAWNVAAELVPVALGGRAESAHRLVTELRPLFRRDPSLAVDLVVAPLAAATIVWESGDDAQQQDLASHLLAGARIAGRVRDDEHVRIQRAGTGWAAHGRTPLMAATADADLWATPFRDPSGSTGLLLSAEADVRDDADAPVETVGLRATRFATRDLSGRRFSSRALVHEIDTAGGVRARSRVRILIAALAVATVDTALRLAIPYAASRELYRGTVLDIPHARGLLAEARTDLLIADAIAEDAIAALDQRGGVPAQAELAASVLIPLLLSDVMKALSVLFGSTFYARVDPYAIFETLFRDVGSFALLGLGGATSRPTLTIAAQHGVDVCRSARKRPDLVAADDRWLESAVARLESRISGRREVLTESAIESAVEDLSDRVASRLSLTFDRIAIFGDDADAPSPAVPPNDEKEGPERELHHH
jgi:hypothetical protein